MRDARCALRHAPPAFAGTRQGLDLCRFPLLALLAFACVLVAAGCGGETSSERASRSANLLEGQRPSKVEGVRRPEVLTDGIMARTADPWNTELTAIFRHESSFVEYDLGSTKPIRAGFLQADNNDTYTIAVSDDDVTFRPVWSAPPRPGLGLQERSAQELKGAGRYVRISAAGGDRAYSLSEVQLFSEVPAVFPPRSRPRGARGARAAAQPDPALCFRARVWLITTSAGRLDWRVPPPSRSPCGRAPVSCRRSTRRGPSTTAPSRWSAPPPPRSRLSWCSPRIFSPRASAVLARRSCLARLLCRRFRAAFFNLGYPQFRDHRTDQPCFVHNFDMRVYYRWPNTSMS